jgi:hypothetical protein
MIPTASGVFSSGDRRTSIDLGCRANNTLTFFELKWWDGDNPLYAAMEILAYGLMWLQARIRCEEMHYVDASRRLRPALDAQTVRWVVLAPERYYKRYVVKTFERAMSEAIAALAEKKLRGITASFAFEQLAIEQPTLPSDEIRQVLSQRKPVSS